LRKYEPDARMREKLLTFYEKLRSATSRLSPTGSGVMADDVQAPSNARGTPFLESGFRRSARLLRRSSRIRQWLRGWDKRTPLRINNKIKDLVDGLVGNRNLRRDKLDEHRIMLNALFTRDAGDTQATSGQSADALAYLDHTLRKLTPREMQTLETVLTGSHELAPVLRSSPALHEALERSLSREIHIRDLMRHVEQIETAVNLGRFTESARKRRGRALVAAADDYHAAAARVPDDISAVELTRLAMQRRQELAATGAGTLKNRRLVASALDDMHLVLGRKSEDGKRSRQHVLDVCAYTAQQA
jgi:hypothetical protein